jgi:hypothetical protein
MAKINIVTSWLKLEIASKRDTYDIERISTNDNQDLETRVTSDIQNQIHIIPKNQNVIAPRSITVTQLLKILSSSSTHNQHVVPAFAIHPSSPRSR